MGRNKVHIQNKNVPYPVYIMRGVYDVLLRKRGNKKNKPLANLFASVVYFVHLYGVEELQKRLDLKTKKEYEELLKQKDDNNSNQ